MEAELKYVMNDGYNIAYSTYGRGEHVVVYTPPLVSNVELTWELEEDARAHRFAGSAHRVVMIDKRGVGLSDRTNSPPTFEERISDMLAVMDAEGLGTVSLCGVSEGGGLSLAFAGRHPERVAKIVVVGTTLPGFSDVELAQFAEDGDPETIDIEVLLSTWGTERSRNVEMFMPASAKNPRVCAWFQRFERQSASPGALRAHLASAMLGDVRDDIDRIKCPIFIGHSARDLVVPVATSRLLANLRPDATFRIWDDDNHALWHSPMWQQMISEMVEFVTGTRPRMTSTSQFAVVLFEDIVSSTEQVTAVGDGAWARTVREHDRVADDLIELHGGRRVKSTGDGLLAVFDDPFQAVGAARLLGDRLSEIGLRSRVGLHAGQVEVHPDGDVTGIAVNLAARIEGEGEAGDVCASSTLRDLLLGTDVRFDSLGPRELKGIDFPVEVVRLA